MCDLSILFLFLIDELLVLFEKSEDVLVVVLAGEDLRNLFQSEFKRSQPGDDACSLHLGFSVVAVLATFIHAARDKQCLLVVEAKRLDSQSGDSGKLADAVHSFSRGTKQLIRHVEQSRPSRKGRVKRRLLFYVCSGIHPTIQSSDGSRDGTKPKSLVLLLVTDSR